LSLLKEAEEKKPSAEPEKKAVSEERNKKALEAFSRILELVNSRDSRQEVLPQIEGIYYEIIMTYPETPLAQESYWRLISIYVNDYSPPSYDKALLLYDEFLRYYPRSGLKGLIEETLARSYYKNARWKELLRLCEPTLVDYNEKGKIPRPLLLYLYSESSFRLGSLEEAEAGYNLLIELFPNAALSRKSKARLEEIRIKIETED